MPMDILFEGFTCQKNGATDQQNDDAYAHVPRSSESSTTIFRCAIADGATESLFAGKWANCVARRFAHGRLNIEKREQTLFKLQNAWAKFLNAQELPWYARSKADIGSFTTLLGLELLSSCRTSNGIAKWIATAIGDSCLFLIRDESLVTSFPYDTPDRFNNRPHLLASNPKYNDHYVDWLFFIEGELLVGDTFYLMSDALSIWFLRETNIGKKPWLFLRDMGTQDAPSFNDWITSLRCSDDQMNDDATMLRIEVESVE